MLLVMMVDSAWHGLGLLGVLCATFYYTTESTPWVSNAVGLHCATQLSKPVLHTSYIHYYRFSYKNRNVLYTCFELYLYGCFGMHLASIDI